MESTDSATEYRRGNGDPDTFQLDTTAIPQSADFTDGDELRSLGLRAYDQAQVEQSVLTQIDTAIRKNEWAQRIKFANRAVAALNKKFKAKQEELRNCKNDSTRQTLQNEATAIKRSIIDAQKLLTRLLSTDGESSVLPLPSFKQNAAAQSCSGTNRSQPGVSNETSFDASTGERATGESASVNNIFQKLAQTETERERLIRLGEITPLDDTASTQCNKRSADPVPRVLSSTRTISSSHNAAARVTDVNVAVKTEPESELESDALDTDSDSDYVPTEPDVEYKPTPVLEHVPERKLKRKHKADTGIRRRQTKRKREEDSGEEELANFDRLIGEADANDSDTDVLEDTEADAEAQERKESQRALRNRLDDSDDRVYEARVLEYRKRCIADRELLKQTTDSKSVSLAADHELDFVALENGLRIPRTIWTRLFKYQQTGVRWLLQLHAKRCGGVIGDEMGLGKTIQVIAFLSALRCSYRFRSSMRASIDNAPLSTPSSNSHASRKTSSSAKPNSKAIWSSQTSADVRYIVDEGSDLGAQMTLRRELSEYGSTLGPVLIVCPATMLYQWLYELHAWYPPFRVLMLHATGPSRGRLDDRSLIRLAAQKHCILLTTYQTLRARQDDLLVIKWHYVILDEGQQIRNPETQTSIVCKQFATPHRIVLSGCPIQNNLRELWSLYDFVFPGLLGLLADFEQHFAVPIVQGGYANASQIEVESAYRCACVLRDTISPYLLRRVKADVKISAQLPNKTEQVLFCRLTREQRQAYKQLLSAPICQRVLLDDKTQAERERNKVCSSGVGFKEGQLFAMLVLLRKVCNHPDLLRLKDMPEQADRDRLLSVTSDSDFGNWQLSGKMTVLHNLLRIWHRQGHRVLVFAQTRQVLNVIEKYVRTVGAYRYLRMDGATAIGKRQTLVRQYNQTPEIFLFLLTTRVGGVGVNLTGADRVVLFEPDWNPTTDAQARERVWRIGQTRDVTVYRLLTSGTIEEKIYHRQIFKQFLTNRILSDPRQRRFFKTNGLRELFTLHEEDDDDEMERSTSSTGAQSSKRKGRRNQTGVIFAGTEMEIDLNKIKRRTSQHRKDESQPQEDVQEQSPDEEEERKARARELARRLNLKFSEAYLGKKQSESNNGAQQCSSASNSHSNEKSAIQSNANGPSSSRTPDATHSHAAARDHHGSSSKSSHSNSTHRNRHRSHGKVKVDGERVANVARKSTWRSSADHKHHDKKTDRSSSRSENSQQNSTDDDFVLGALLRSSKTKNMLHSALRHDRIVDADCEMNADELLIRRAAERVARSAVEALERSRSLYPHLQAPPVRTNSGLSTWNSTPESSSGVLSSSIRNASSNTSQPPAASLPSTSTATPSGAKPRFGIKKNPSLLPAVDSNASQSSGTAASSNGAPSVAVINDSQADKQLSSADIMKEIRDRDLLRPQKRRPTDSEMPRPATLHRDSDFYTALLNDVRDFVAVQAPSASNSLLGGQATTQQIVGRFRDRVGTDEDDLETFKCMLKRICVFQRTADGTGVWRLKEEFE